MHWNWIDVLCVTVSLSGGIAVIYIAFCAGCFWKNICVERMLADEITRINQENTDREYDAVECLHTDIRTQTIKDCMRLI